MIIQCPTCSAQYDMLEGSIKPEGRKVRCSACKTVWLAHNEPAPQLDQFIAAPIIKERQISALEEQAVTEPILPRLNLKVERTTEDDWLTGDDTVTDNSQDDIDALFDTPTATEFGSDFIEEPLPEPVIAKPTRFGALTTWFSKRRALKPAAKQAAPIKAKSSRAKKAKKSKALPVAASLATALFLGLGMSVVYRTNVVHALPQSAALYKMVGLPVNLRGVNIANVTSKISIEQGTPQLTVEGEITNITHKTEKLARLRLAIRSDNGTEMYSWKATLDKPVLEPGETMKFKRKLSAPPEDGHDVIVRFETRDDVVAGVQ